MFNRDSTVDWLAGRLVGTIIQHKQKLVSVVKIVRRGEGDEDLPVIYAADVENGEEVREVHTSDSWNFRPFPLGYVNSVRGCHYIMRIPRRRWKQGLDQGGLIEASHTPIGDFEIAKKVNLPSLIGKPLVDCLKGNYPSFKEVLKSSVARKGSGLRAFSRDFALQTKGGGGLDISLFHQGTRVGWVTDGRVTLGGKFKYLKELLYEAGVDT